MIDFHTHILPGIDDGSRDIDMTEQMLAAEAAQGVSDIYATPHFYAHRVTVDKFLERRSRALDAKQKLLSERPDLPRITAGAEVYYFNGMGCAEQLSQLCIEGTDIILLEMPFDQWHGEQLKDIKDIINKQGLRVVLAHVERYIGFQKDRRVWDEIINMPLTIQMNAGPFIVSGLHGRHRQRFCLDMLKNYVFLIKCSGVK